MSDSADSQPHGTKSRAMSILQEISLLHDKLDDAILVFGAYLQMPPSLAKISFDAQLPKSTILNKNSQQVIK